MATETVVSNKVILTLGLDVFVVPEVDDKATKEEIIEAERALKRRVITSIDDHRKVCKKVSAIYGQALLSGATIRHVSNGDDTNIVLVPNKEATSDTLKSLFGGKSGMTMYELRSVVLEDLYAGNAKSLLFDDVREKVTKAYKSGDPVYNAKRNFLHLQAVRKEPRMERVPITMFAAHLKKKAFVKRTLTLSWRKDVGEVAFKIGNLDGMRNAVWRKIKEGWNQENPEYKFLSVDINYKRKDSKPDQLCLRIAYERNKKDTTERPNTLRIDINNKLETNKQYLISAKTEMKGEKKIKPLLIDQEAVLAWLAQHQQRSKALDKRVSACGSKTRPWGHRRAWLRHQAVRDRNTLNRERVIEDYNKAWVRRLVDWAVKEDCGTIVINKAERTIGQYDWNWSNMLNRLINAANDFSITVLIQ
jgi:hypothetical protein